MTAAEVIVAIGTPIFRSAAGWLQASLEDNAISRYEWKLLVETITRVGVLQVAMYFGLQAFGFDSSILAASAAAFLADKLFGSIKG